MAKMRHRPLILFVIGCLLVNATYASNTSNKLNEVINKIKNVQSILKQHQTKKNTLEKDLQQTETAINQISLQLQQTSTKLKSKKQAIAMLMNKQQKLQNKIHLQQQILLKQIRFAYLLGLSRNQFECLLRAEDPTKINRLLTYNHYLASQNKMMLVNLQQDLQLLKNNKQEIAANASHLSQIQKDQLAEQNELASNKKNQEYVLNTISLQVKTKEQQLNELLKNKKNLENIIVTLQKKPVYSGNFLTNHNGKFPWPTTGKVIEQFGSTIQHSELKQNGVLIAAPEGHKVYSVAPGRVIFANWLPGYGLLLIIDHGKGYMTLYGNNGLLYKKVNDLVGKHDLVAAVGHTGGQKKCALYFALRHNGKPINPSTWCG